MKDGFSVGGDRMISDRCDNTKQCSAGLECVDGHCTNMCRKEVVEELGQVDWDYCTNIKATMIDGSYDKQKILCNNSWYQNYNPNTGLIEKKTCYWSESDDPRERGCWAYNNLLDDTFLKCKDASYYNNYMECGSCPNSEAKCNSNCKAYEVNNCLLKGKKYQCLCPSNITKCDDT